MCRVIGSGGSLRRPTRAGRCLARADQVNRTLSCVFWLIISICLTVTGPLTASDKPVQWRNPTPETQAAAPNEATESSRHLFLRFSNPLTAQQRAELEQNGIRLLAYLGNDAYFAARAANKSKTQSTAGIESMTEIQPIRREWKLHPRLSGGPPPDWAMVPPAAGARNRAQVSATTDTSTELVLAAYVLFHPDVPLVPDAAAACTRHGAVVRAELPSVNGLVIELALASVPALADDDTVQWIEPALPRMSEVNDSSRNLIQADLVQAAPYGLDGSGINVLLYDGGTAWPDHPDFGGRVFIRDASGLSSHATHVAGTIGGSGKASDGKYRGMAPRVAIQSYGFEYDESGIFLYSNPGDIEADYREAIFSYGAEIASNSIGSNVASNGFPCELEGSYGVTSAVIDAIVAGSLGSPMRVVWAAGNERSNGRCGKTYSTIGPPAPAKNTIAVGAINSNDDSMTWFSSWGPTDDGRLRPDVVAPGCQANDDYGVKSTGTDGGYTTLCGTSMATPAVTGVCALLLQDYKRLHPGEPLPPNAMLKAILVQTATDLGAVGPDYQTGYGSVRAREAVDLLRSGSLRQDALSQGESKTFLVQVPAGAAVLKATLAWDDPSAAVNTTPALVNDLDIEAIGPFGTELHYPWTLDPAQPELNAVRTQPDRLNNLEQILVDSPEPGLWMIRVHGYAVPLGPQRFSLVATPGIVGCSSTGTISFGVREYRCGDNVIVTVNDCDLNTDPAIAETATIHIVSTSDPAGRDVVLGEAGPDSGVFVGSVSLSDSPSPDHLPATHGDSLTATYRDADAGSGTPTDATTSAIVDCVAPIISDLRIDELTALRAVISFKTDEVSFARIRFGTSCSALEYTAIDTLNGRTHAVTLSDLRPATRYAYAVEATDAAGNLIRDDGGGACHEFTTPDAPDYFTQHFLLEPKTLDHKSVLFTPNGSIDYYAACVESITELPVDPAGGTWLRNAAEITLGNSKQAYLYGIGRNRFWVNSEGTITFGQWDNTSGDALTRHFALPRISALFEWLTPAETGHVSWKQLTDRAAVTWEHACDAVTGGLNTFQVELFFDGRIRLSWLDINANDPLVGLSMGGGIPTDYLESLLAEYGTCISDTLRITPDGFLAARGLQGGPFEPYRRFYTLTNVSDPPMNLSWSAETAAPWISVTPADGELPPGDSQEVEILVNAEAAGLSANTIEYSAGVRFLNAATGLAQEREVRLAVQAASPPVAHDVLATTTMNSPIQIALAADDDGRPDPPGTLTYQALYGPSHGQITAIDGTGMLTYTPDTDFDGIDQFTYRANDGGVAPGGGDSNTATVTIRVMGTPQPAIHPSPADGATDVPIDQPFLAAEAVDVSRLRGGIVAAAYPADVTDPHFTDVRDKIMATGRFSDVGIVNAGRVTPSPADLKSFDAVLVWSNDQFADPFTLGDRLADYVDGGGGVVLAAFANVNVRSFSSLRGRFLLDDYFCVDYPSDALFPPLLDRPRQTLERIFLKNHPTISGVTQFDGGNRSFRVWSSYLTPGASFVANWSDGAPLIAVREINATPRVDLAMHPPSDALDSEFWKSDTDGGLILANALAYAAGRSGCAATYDIHFDDDNPPARLIGENVPDPRCPIPAPLAYATTYYWQIVAHNAAGRIPGPVWSFRTPERAALTVSDSVSPPDDLAISFGSTAIGSPRQERLALRNDHPSQTLRLTNLSLVPATDIAEDFEDGQAQGWQPAESGEWNVENGALRVSTSTPDSHMQAAYAERTWQDASIRLSLWRTGSPFVSAGLAFRASQDFDWAAGRGVAYFVSLSGTGSFYVARYEGGQFTFIQSWTSFKSLKILTGTNDVVVNFVGPDIDVYLNGQLAWAGRDTTITGAGRVALLAYSNPPGSQGATHYFDGIQVAPPLPLATARQSTTTGLPPVAIADSGTDTLTPYPELPYEADSSSLATVTTATESAVPDPCGNFRIAVPASMPLQLAPGESIDLDVAFEPAWQGPHACDVLIESNDADHPQQRVHLTGDGGPAYLQITPADDLVIQGPEGGPFAPASGQYTLTNTGPAAVHWTIATAAGWVAASPAYGSLEAGQSVATSIRVTDSAYTLSPGDYKIIVMVTDTATGISENRTVHLSICELPQAATQPDPPDQTTGVGLAPWLSWNKNVSPLQTCRSIGNAKISYQDQETALADVVTASSDQLLHEITVKLSFTGDADLYYLIGESPSREGPFSVTWQRTVPTTGQGETYYSSGSLDYRLVAGRFYAIGVAWGDALIGYGLDYRDYPATWAAGTIEGLLSGRFMPPLAEMPADFFAGAATPIKLCLDDAGAVAHSVYLWKEGDAPALACSDITGTTCRPTDSLAPQATYFWKVVAESTCGGRESDIWSFTTASCEDEPLAIDRSPGRRPVSRKEHSSAGTFDIDLLAPPSGQSVAIEPRTGGPSLLLVWFTRAVQAIGEPITSSVALTGAGAANASITDVVVQGNLLSITCDGLTRGVATLSFPGIADASTAACGVQDSLSFGILPGDVNGDAAVNVLDLILTRNRMSQQVDSQRFLFDVNTDGRIDLLDLVSVRNSQNTRLGP